jgi:YidC/Oxa1 family membrane protein insertase
MTMNNPRVFLWLAVAMLGFLLWETWQTDYGPDSRLARAAAAAQAARNAGAGAPTLESKIPGVVPPAPAGAAMPSAAPAAVPPAAGAVPPRPRSRRPATPVLRPPSPPPRRRPARFGW